VARRWCGERESGGQAVHRGWTVQRQMGIDGVVGGARDGGAVAVLRTDEKKAVDVSNLLFEFA
jgi:hypothetical protein